MADVRGKTIIIDCDQIFLAFINAILISEGLTDALLYSNPDELLEHLKHDGRPAAVISTYNLPCITGVELLDKINKIYPGVPSLIITITPEALIGKMLPYPVLDKGKYFEKKLPEFIRKHLK